MANKSLFSSLKALMPRATARNEAGGPAYELESKHALAQFAATGCFNQTFYTSAESQLETLKSLIELVKDNTYLAKLAVYSRERAFMKDMPAALLASLAKRDTVLFHQVFDRVVDNGRVLRTLFQMIRSGQFGKKGLSGSLQRAFHRWLNTASVEKLLSASIGNDPSLRDILRLARPTPPDNSRRAFYGWLTGKEIEKWLPATEADLPEQVRLLKQFRAAATVDEQVYLLEGSLHARWDLLADSVKGYAVWAAIARSMGAQALRMNLNTLERHGVLADQVMVQYIADRLADPNEIRRSRQFPYQYFSAYLNVSDSVPQVIKNALNKGAELACENVPALPGPVVIGLDVSGSMQSPVTGHLGRGSSKMRCVDVAALFASAILRRNPDSVVIPFDQQAFTVKLDPADSILSLAKRLAAYGGGGTDCSLPIKQANKEFKKRRFAGIVLVSDNESWIHKGRAFGFAQNGSTGVMAEWTKFAQQQVRLQGREAVEPKLVCIDLQPNTTTQAPDRHDILNVGGFSDAVFEVVAAFLASDRNRFVTEVEAVTL